MSDPIDLQEHAKASKTVPETGPYKIRVNKDFHIWPSPKIKGREILQLASKDEQKNAAYYFVHGKPQRVQLADSVDLTTPGVERFETLPLDQTEG